MASGDSSLIDIPVTTESQSAVCHPSDQLESLETASLTDNQEEESHNMVLNCDWVRWVRDCVFAMSSITAFVFTMFSIIAGKPCRAQAESDIQREMESLDEGPRIHSSEVNSGMTGQKGDKDLNLLCQAYKLVKGRRTVRTLDKRLFDLKSPIGSTILHIAASYGNDNMVDVIIDKAPNLSHLFTAKNSNDDTPLHVAARAGHFHTLQKLFHGYFKMVENDRVEIFSGFGIKNLLKSKNKKGNTILHDILFDKQNEDTIIELFDTIIPNSGGKPLSTHAYDVALEVTNKQGKSALYVAIEQGYEELVITILDNCNKEKIPLGKSPVLAAIMKQDRDMLKKIIESRPKWKYLEDKEGRIPLHWAASTGYLDGVRFLLEQCGACSIECDEIGFYPLHLASEGGHIKVLKELLSRCPDPKEIVDNNGRNILHIAAVSGKLNVVKHILQDPSLQKMINDMDADGNTPLHLATLHSRPKVVYALTRGKSVELDQMNFRNQTALDINLEQVDGENQPLRQRLVWTALKSADSPRSSMMILPKNYTHNPKEGDSATSPADAKMKNQLNSSEDKVKQEESSEDKIKQEKSSERKKGPNLERFKDRIDILVVVSTLIITATFAGGFTLPGGTDNGIPTMLERTMFHIYIYCITISMYGAISVTLILIWARLGDISLLALSLKLTKPLLGITVVTLSLAFLAGVCLVISPLGWLATSFLIIATISAVIVALLYTVLWLPSKSSFIVCRYLSYLPFQLLASLAEGDEDNVNHKAGSKHQSCAKRFLKNVWTP